MYRKINMQKTSIDLNQTQEGETIEMKIQRIVNNKEPISDNAPIIFTERKDGVLPGHNIKTDRWEVAIDAMDKVTKTHQAKRQERLDKRKEELEKAEKPIGKGNETDGGPKSTQGTDNK